MPYTHGLFRTTLSDLEWLSKIFSDKKHRTASLRQLSLMYFHAVHKLVICNFVNAQVFFVNFLWSSIAFRENIFRLLHFRLHSDTCAVIVFWRFLQQMIDLCLDLLLSSSSLCVVCFDNMYVHNILQNCFETGIIVVFTVCDFFWNMQLGLLHKRYTKLVCILFIYVIVSCNCMLHILS